MNKKEVLEIKRRFKKGSCTFTRLTGCYVDAEHNKVTQFGKTFLNLEDEEAHKYLDIAKKSMSGTVGNNLLELQFPNDEEVLGGKQQFLMGLRDSKLKNDGLLDTFYDMVISTYDYVGNYLILLFHDAYDVMTKTTDNNKLDESEEVYEYLLCAICPVSLSKPGLGYREDENSIGPRLRDWVVGSPDTAFVFPCFTDRSTDIHSTLFYTKDSKKPHAEFMELGLGCDSKLTATEKKIAFQSMIEKATGDNEGVYVKIQEKISEHLEESEDEEEPVITTEVLSDILNESYLDQESATSIKELFKNTFENELPAAEQLIDTKVLAEQEVMRETEEKVRAKLEKEIANEQDYDGIGDVKTYDVILRVKPEKVEQVKTENINGKKCIVIPLEENEYATVNGINTIV